MSLRAGARTVVRQCLNVREDEYVLVVNDGNDPDLIDALLSALENVTSDVRYLEYEEPERHGTEPPAAVAEALRESEVFIAPTRTSLSHTEARRNASAAGARGVTMPGVTRDIWSTSLLADYDEVERYCRVVYDLVESAAEAHIETPSGTDLTLEVDIDSYEQDTGLVHEPGDFGNLPAGETFGAPVAAEGTLVIDHFPYAEAGTRIEIRDNEAVAIEHPDGGTSELAEAFDEVDGARNVAEFGIGTNPAATLIGNTLQDEKVLGTVHVAFGDNSSMVPDGDPRRVTAGIHWDAICEDPTVTFDAETVLNDGEPLFAR